MLKFVSHPGMSACPIFLSTIAL